MTGFVEGRAVMIAPGAHRERVASNRVALVIEHIKNSERR